MSQSSWEGRASFLRELEKVSTRSWTAPDLEHPERFRHFRGIADYPVGSWGDYQPEEMIEDAVLYSAISGPPHLDLQSEGSGPFATVRRAWERILMVLFPESTIVTARVCSSLSFSSWTVAPRGAVHRARARAMLEERTHAVLEQLRDDGLDMKEKRQAVLEAEVLDFPEHDVPELCVLLGAFILRHRDSNVAEDLVAVGAAVRKLVAYLPCGGFGGLAELLVPGRRSPVPLEVELEVAKTVVWKLAADPPVKDNPEPALGDRLWEIAQTYLNPRLIAREKHGATALNAALSLMLLRSPHAARISELLREAKAQWFTELLCRRAERLRASLRRTVSADRFPAVSRGLTELLEQRGG